MWIVIGIDIQNKIKKRKKQWQATNNIIKKWQ
jgi:hypothetical protein